MTTREACEPETREQMYHEASHRHAEWRLGYVAGIQSRDVSSGISQEFSANCTYIILLLTY